MNNRRNKIIEVKAKPLQINRCIPRHPYILGKGWKAWIISKQDTCVNSNMRNECYKISYKHKFINSKEHLHIALVIKKKDKRV